MPVCANLPRLCRTCLRLRLLLLVSAVVCVTVCPPGRAESERSLSGAVYDSLLGVPVQDAIVSLVGTTFSARTNVAGNFEILSVPSGSWELQVTRYGYHPSAGQLVDVVEGFERHLRIGLAPKPILLSPSVVEHSGAIAAAPNGIRKYDSRQIKEAGHRTIAEALDAIPGVRVYGNSESPGGTRVSVGGESPERVAVLLDGVPLATGGDGAVNLEVIPLSAVKSIEVSPGAQSAGSGDAAIGGTVNLLTRSTSQASHQVFDLSSGAFGSYRAAMTSGLNLGSNSLESVLEASGRGNHFKYPDADSSALRQGVQARAWRGFVSFSPGEHPAARATAFAYNSTVGIPGALEQLQPGATSHNARYRAQGSWDWAGSAHVSAGCAIWIESGDDHIRSLETRIKTDSEWKERFIGARQDLRLSLGSFESKSAAELRSRRMEGKDRIPSQSFGVHRQTEFSMRSSLNKTLTMQRGILSLTLAGAVDGDGRSAPVYSPRADLGFTHRAGWYTRAGWGRSFRRPPLTSLFWKADAFVAGNPNLRPERSAEWDAAAGYHRGGFLVETRYFQRRIRDIISWERDAMGRYQPRNVPRSFIFGREDHLTAEFWTGRISLDYSHVFNSAHDRSGELNHDGMVLVMSPRHTHDLVVRLSTGRVDGRLSGRWVSPRELRRDNSSGKRLPAYRLFDGYARLTVRRSQPSVRIGIRVDNITKERVDLLERYPSPGRAFSIEATVEL